MIKDNLLLDYDDPILITGSNGFIGSKVVEKLLCYGFKNLRCFVRPSSTTTTLNKIISSFENTQIEVIKGNLLSRDDCKKATEGVSVIFHLAAGIEKSFPGAYMNSVITTRNLLDATLNYKNLKRFLNVSSFAVYSNLKIKRGGLLDETCEVESQPEQGGEAYCYAKVKQDELVLEYNKKYDIPYVIVRPGVVYGPGKHTITGRVGIGTFGIFLHLGGSNRIPFTYVDNCADAIIMAGIKKGVDGEIFNIVDDDLPRSRKFLRMYKKNVRHFKSIYIPYRVTYILCYLWEKYSKWSEGQLPLAFNRRRCATEWKGNRYSNEKLKNLLGWKPKIPLDEALKLYFDYCRKNGGYN
ncbi:MAG: NAD-dependent epimerase/dehydratase family protein [Candidatus Hodarchaeota archaeon]